MNTKLLLEVKKVVTSYLEFKQKKKMGFSITLSDVENIPIISKIKVKK